jgi:hypothetical protein
MASDLKQAYIWTREHSPDRLRQLDATAYIWEELFFEPKNRGHYQPIQFALKSRSGWMAHEKFEATLDGKAVEVHLQVVSARVWFLRELYLRACTLTRERYPDFDAHHFVDGDRVGERRIVFHSERHALSRNHLWTTLWWLDREEAPKITETWFQEPCSSWGDPASVIDENRSFNNCIDPAHVRYVVVRDVDEVDASIMAQVVASIREHGKPEVSTRSLSFDFDTFRDDFIELSEPELVFLNWADARKPLRESDKALLKAAEKVDFAAIRQALAEGADPNITDGEDPVLGIVITGWRDHLATCEADDEDLAYLGGKRPTRKIPLVEVLDALKLLLNAGAHPDRFDPDGLPAIVTAALVQIPEIAALLLEYGADPSISPFWDDGLGMYPAAWGYATDGFSLNEAGAREVYYTMVRCRSSTMFEQATEDQDRLDAELPDNRRSWRNDKAQSADSDTNGPDKTDAQIVNLQDSMDVTSTLEPRSDKTLTEDEAVFAFAKAWNRLEPDEFLALLAPDARYASQWVFEELEGKRAIMDYLRGKMQTVRTNSVNNPGVRVRVEIGRTTQGEGGRPCAFMTQGSDGTVQAAVLFEVGGNKIARYDLCIPQLLGAVRTGVFPV